MFFESVGDGIPDVTVPTGWRSQGFSPEKYCDKSTTHRSRLYQMYRKSRPHLKTILNCDVLEKKAEILRLAGAPSTTSPTRRRGGPFSKCALTPSAPMNSAVSRLSLPIFTCSMSTPKPEPLKNCKVDEAVAYQ
jgi:hypothetical protein